MKSSEGKNSDGKVWEEKVVEDKDSVEFSATSTGKISFSVKCYGSSPGEALEKVDSLFTAALAKKKEYEGQL